MPYDKNRLSELLKKICQHTGDESIDYAKHRRYRIIGGAGSAVVIQIADYEPFVSKMPDEGTATLHVVDNGCEAFDEFVDEVLRDEEMSSLVGKAAVSRQLTDLIRKIGGNWPEEESDPAQFVRMKLLKPLREGIKKWQIYVPIVNLRLFDAIQIGNVHFAMYDGGLPLSHFTSGRFDDNGQRLPPHDKKGRLPPQIVSTAAEYECWASTTVQCHQKNLAVVARREVGRSVNALRAFTHVLFRRDNRRLFDMAGFVHKGTFVAWGRDVEGNLEFPSKVVGYLAKFELQENALQFLNEKMEFGRLGAIVGTKEGSRNSFQQTIAVASDWLGRAAASDTLEDEFVKVTIGLERLLICDEEDTTTERIAIRLALLIADKYDERRLVQQSAKRLYDIRSRIVHTGFIGVSIDDMREMGGLTIDALVNCLRLADTLSSHEGLRDLLNRKMLE